MAKAAKARAVVPKTAVLVSLTDTWAREITLQITEAPASIVR